MDHSLDIFENIITEYISNTVVVIGNIGNKINNNYFWDNIFEEVNMVYVFFSFKSIISQGAIDDSLFVELLIRLSLVSTQSLFYHYLWVKFHADILRQS